MSKDSPSAVAALRLVCHELSVSGDQDEMRASYASLARSYAMLVSYNDVMQLELVRSWAARDEALLRLHRGCEDVAFWKDLATRALLFLRLFLWSHPGAFGGRVELLLRWAEDYIDRYSVATRVEMVQI